jgi:hypothetical protein
MDGSSCSSRVHGALPGATRGSGWLPSALRFDYEDKVDRSLLTSRRLRRPTWSVLAVGTQGRTTRTLHRLRWAGTEANPVTIVWPGSCGRRGHARLETDSPRTSPHRTRPDLRGPQEARYERAGVVVCFLPLERDLRYAGASAKACTRDGDGQERSWSRRRRHLDYVADGVTALRRAPVIPRGLAGVVADCSRTAGSVPRIGTRARGAGRWLSHSTSDTSRPGRSPGSRRRLATARRPQSAPATDGAPTESPHGRHGRWCARSARATGDAATRTGGHPARAPPSRRFGMPAMRRRAHPPSPKETHDHHASTI